MLRDHTPLREKVFTAQFEKRFFDWYHRVFNIIEIETSKALQLFFGATLLSFLATFDNWISRPVLTVNQYLAHKHTCWPWFQSCGEYYFLQMLPFGYSQTIFYMGLFGIILLVAYFMYKREWVLAHLLMAILLLWKLTAGLLLTYDLFGNYDYYHVVFTIILLLLPLKLFFLKLVLVLFYSLSATAKLHATWILGTYFSALQTGLPLFPDWSIPIWTNLVIFMQIVGAWLLFSRRAWLQRTVLTFFIIFHLYSGILVSYHYPLTVLPSLIILFGLYYRQEVVPLNKKSIPGWCLVIALIFLQLWSVIIPGDERMTGEANRFGMYMFEANHQCISQATIYLTDGRTDTLEKSRATARHRCDPYRYWFPVKDICRRFDNVERIEWTLDHSINGGAFHRIVETENACTLEYSIFKHNDWIQSATDQNIIGWPVKNQYY